MEFRERRRAQLGFAGSWEPIFTAAAAAAADVLGFISECSDVETTCNYRRLTDGALIATMRWLIAALSGLVKCSLVARFV